MGESMTECGVIFNRHKWIAIGEGYQVCTKCGSVEHYTFDGWYIRGRAATFAEAKEAIAVANITSAKLEADRQAALNYVRGKP